MCVPMVRIAATEMVTDRKVLAEVATTDPAAGVRIGAVGRLDDQALLGELAGETSEESVPLKVGDIAATAAPGLTIPGSAVLAPIDYVGVYVILEEYTEPI